MTVPVIARPAPPLVGQLHSMGAARPALLQRLSFGSRVSGPTAPSVTATAPTVTSTPRLAPTTLAVSRQISEAPLVAGPFQSVEELQSQLDLSKGQAAAAELNLGNLQEEIRELRRECQLSREESERLGKAIGESIPAGDHFEILRNMSHEHLTAAYLWEQKERDADENGRVLFEQAAEQLKSSLAKREAHLQDFATVGTELQRASASHKASEARCAKLEDQLRQLTNVYELVGTAQSQVETVQRHAMDIWRQLQRKLAEADDLRAKCAELKHKLTGAVADGNPSSEGGGMIDSPSAPSARALVLAHLDALEGPLVRPTTTRDSMAEEEQMLPRLPMPASVSVSMRGKSPPEASFGKPIHEFNSDMIVAMSMQQPELTASLCAPATDVTPRSEAVIETAATDAGEANLGLAGSPSAVGSTEALPSLGATGVASTLGTRIHTSVTPIGATSAVTPTPLAASNAVTSTPLVVTSAVTPTPLATNNSTVTQLGTTGTFAFGNASAFMPSGAMSASPPGFSTRSFLHATPAMPTASPRSSSLSSPGLVSALQTASRATPVNAAKPVVEAAATRHCGC